MRLINTDKLEDEIIFDEMPSSLYGLNDTILDIIDGQEEVEAIPVEYIKETINRYRYLMARSEKKIAKGYQDMVNALESVIRDWRRENG